MQEKIKALKNLGYTRTQAQQILDTLNTVKATKAYEALFRRIIYWANNCTGDNASFSPEHGTISMNELRKILGLDALSREELEALGY